MIDCHVPPRRAVIAILVALLLAIVGTASSRGAIAAPIRVGVLAYRGGDHAEAVWGPTIGYLSRALPDDDVVMVALDLAGIRKAVAEGSVDFILTNTGNYVELEAAFGVSRIATLHSLRSGESGGAVGSVIVTRRDEKDITTLADLRGRSVIAVDAEAFGGFQIGWGEMLKAGVDPFKDLSELRFSGFPVDRIAFAVTRGEVDAGIMRACVLEDLAREGRVKLSDFHVLGERNVPGFDCLLSTPLYPDWPFARLAATPEALAKKVAIALFEMRSDDPAAVAGNYEGWSVPMDYQPVHALFWALRIGPYANLRNPSLLDVAKANWHWLVMALIALAWWIWHALRVEHLVKVRTGELEAVNLELRREMAERRRAEDEARERQREMDHVGRLSILGEMASNLAHELNQPLGAIANYARGCTRRISAGLARPEDLVSATEAIAHEAERAGKVVARIRAFVKKRPIQLGATDVNAAISSALALCEPRARGDRVPLALDLGEGLPAVAADPVQIEQVVINLVKNALDAMTDDAARLKGIRIASHLAEPGKVEVSVADHGPGFSLEASQRLFEAYFTTKRDGMGLGLSICRTIIESHGGHLTARDNPDGGAIVAFTLPTLNKEGKR
ncbi:sensor histidine kinase [Consotaella salsifontis]|uniref:histidine kinase n=1 Tax=Consotaella salsifontis TaxID=1365950 RepID=A0A1T4PMX3_9HYPH|nr:sensor histidine kinase [Consotaella salsifontis]SJZ92238.1 two-component system, LuxR family, sensor histidine kinase TtrS [Consotaella salsifontis]